MLQEAGGERLTNKDNNARRPGFHNLMKLLTTGESSLLQFPGKP